MIPVHAHASSLAYFVSRWTVCRLQVGQNFLSSSFAFCPDLRVVR
jgi:hypothetical protein